MKWGAILIGVITVSVLSWWAGDIVTDRNHLLEVLEPITLLKDAPQHYPETNMETGKLIPGESVEVLRMGFGKDFRAWKVKGPKGQKGWFIETGKNVRVTDSST